MKILIRSFDDHAFCELPDNRLLYGRDTDEICSCLDAMSRIGMFVNGNSIEVGEYKPNLTYNVDFE